MHQHTGNWPGKTVSNASGTCKYKNTNFLFVDIPGTYSLMSNSEEETIARNYICFGNSDLTVIVIDGTCLERNLNLVYQIIEITPRVVLCVNLLDEAKRKGIHINLNKLSELLGIPVVGTIAKKKKTLDKLLQTIYTSCTSENSSLRKNVAYFPIIENCISILLPIVEPLLPHDFKHLARFICLKLIDSDSSLLSEIQKNIGIDFLKNQDIKNKLSEIYALLEKSDININNLKEKIASSIMSSCENVAHNVCTYDNLSYNSRDRKIDKILTSKKFGIPIMIAFLGIIFWLTITGANYPSQMLSSLFAILEEKLLHLLEFIHLPDILVSILINGLYETVAWIVSVMLPPMAIFFPLFTLLEDLGVLPRIAFNLDKYFKKACSSGKQALSMCMGFGCNAAGCVGCRIIDSPREKLIAILTNSFVPCNGRFPILITIATAFVGCYFTGIFSSIISTCAVLAIIILGIILTFVVSKFLSKTILKGVPSSFVLELPPYRKPQVGKIIVRSIFDRTLFVLARAVVVAIPAGFILWTFSHASINNISLLDYFAGFLDPFAKLMGLDGHILTAFILGFPANEIVLPIILMSYTSSSSLVNLEDSFEIR